MMSTMYVTVNGLTIDQQEPTGNQKLAPECASLAFQPLHSFQQAGKYNEKKVGDDGDCQTHFIIHLTTDLCAKK